MSNLSGRTALVTGASRGIGRATALALAKAWAQVIVHYSSSGKEAEAVIAEIRTGGGAPYILVQQLLPAMGQGSSVVFLSSLGARASVGTLSAYAATKGAVATLVTHFASALGERGIRVNAVAPGVVETDMSSFAKTDVGRNIALGMQALKRIAQPEDIGGVVGFLVSDEARWITGASIRVDGGSKL